MIEDIDRTQRVFSSVIQSKSMSGMVSCSVAESKRVSILNELNRIKSTWKEIFSRSIVAGNKFVNKDQLLYSLEYPKGEDLMLDRGTYLLVNLQRQGERLFISRSVFPSMQVVIGSNTTSIPWVFSTCSG